MRSWRSRTKPGKRLETVKEIWNEVLGERQRSRSLNGAGEHRSYLQTKEPAVANNGRLFCDCLSLSASWPGLSRLSTSCFEARKKDVDARAKRGHDELGRLLS